MIVEKLVHLYKKKWNIKNLLMITIQHLQMNQI